MLKNFHRKKKEILDMLKKGQFFLIAALLISGVTIGFGTLYNEAKIERSDRQVYDLSEELYSEIQQTYDSGIIRGKGPAEIQPDIARLASFYAQQNPDSNFQVIYGNTTDLNVLDYNQQTATTRVSGVVRGGAAAVETQEDNALSVQQRKLRASEGNEIQTVYVEVPVTESRNGQYVQARATREFQVQEGQNFYIVVRKKVRNEEVVIARQSDVPG